MEKILIGNITLFTYNNKGTIWYRFFNYDSCAECNICMTKSLFYFSLNCWQPNKGTNGVRIRLSGKKD